MARIVPDLAYNSMGFLADAKRRDERAEELSMEPQEERTKRRRAMRDSSPPFVPRSESGDSIPGGYSGDKNAVYPPVWQQSDNRILATARPSTAPVDVESAYEPPRRRGHHEPARATTSLDSRGFPAPDRSPPYDAEPLCKEAEGYDRLTPESVGRLLWETGVFDGLEGARRSTPDNHRRLEQPTGRDSPQQQGTETRVHERARCADEPAMATLPGAGEDPRFEPPPGHRTAAQADGARKIHPETSENSPEVRVGPVYLQGTDLSTTRAAVGIAVGETLVDRTKIALMAHIPVYSHQECQTDFPRPVPQKPTYVQASTQTPAFPTQHCRRYQVSGDARYSPTQGHCSAEELFVAGEPQYVSDGSSWVLDDADPGRFRSYSPDRHEEMLFQPANEHHQAHPAFHGPVEHEAHPGLCARYDGAEQSIPLPRRQAMPHFNGRNATASSFVTAMENGILDAHTPHYPWGYDGYHVEGQGEDFEMTDDGAVPIHRHVDEETRTYHPHPVHYRTARTAAVQPPNQGEFVARPQRPAFGAHVEEPYPYTQDIRHAPEQPPGPSRPGISSAAQNNVPRLECNMSGYTQDENQINTSGPSHLPARHRHRVDEDLEQAHIEAHWRERQLGFARRYGY